MINFLKNKNPSFLLVLGMIIISGCFLRLYLISYQLVLDDEWHAIAVSLEYPYSYLLTHLNVDATSIPMNLYGKLMIDTFGLNEISVRLLSIIAGMLLVLVFPVLFLKDFNNRIILLATSLIAISPFLIFYSRYFRSYSAMVVLSFIAIYSLYYWLKTDNKHYGCAYVLSGILGVYFHFISILAIGVPLFCAFLFKSLQDLEVIKIRSVDIKPSAKKIFITGLIFLLILASVYLFPFINSGTEFIKEHTFISSHSFTSYIQFLELFWGTSFLPLSLLLSFFLVVGFVFIRKNKPLLFGIILSVLLSYILSILALDPQDIHYPNVLLRYLMPLIPFIFLLGAAGIDRFLNWLQEKINNSGNFKMLGRGVCFIFIIALFFTGPLPSTYSSPNNFTNHAAFQKTYSLLDWEKPYTPFITSQNILGFQITANEVSDFYKNLGEMQESFSIIEYPTLIGDYNMHYFYQHFHKKNVIAGYGQKPELNYTLYKETVQPGAFSKINFEIDIDPKEIYENLKLNGYIDNRGDLTNKFNPLDGLEVNDKYRFYEEPIKTKLIFEAGLDAFGFGAADEKIQITLQTFSNISDDLNENLKDLWNDLIEKGVIKSDGTFIENGFNPMLGLGNVLDNRFIDHVNPITDSLIAVAGIKCFAFKPSRKRCHITPGLFSTIKRLKAIRSDEIFEVLKEGEYVNTKGQILVDKFNPQFSLSLDSKYENYQKAIIEVLASCAGDESIGLQMTFIENREKIKLKNCIDIMDFEAIKNSKAKFIILHKNLYAETISRQGFEVSFISEEFKDIYITQFGKPVFEDQSIIVFQI